MNAFASDQGVPNFVKMLAMLEDKISNGHMYWGEDYKEWLQGRTSGTEGGGTNTMRQAPNMIDQQFQLASAKLLTAEFLLHGNPAHEKTIVTVQSNPPPGVGRKPRHTYTGTVVKLAPLEWRSTENGGRDPTQYWLRAREWPLSPLGLLAGSFTVEGGVGLRTELKISNFQIRGVAVGDRIEMWVARPTTFQQGTVVSVSKAGDSLQCKLDGDLSTNTHSISLDCHMGFSNTEIKSINDPPFAFQLASTFCWCATTSSGMVWSQLKPLPMVVTRTA